MPTDRSNPLSFITACWHCFPSKQEQPPSPTFRSARYNSQLRSNLGIAERPLQLASRMEENSRRTPEARQITRSDPTRTIDLSRPLPPLPPQARSAAQQQQRSRPSSRFPAAVNVGDARKKWTAANMDRQELAELFDVLHATLDHIPYAICGLGALIDHGFRGRKANKVSIICPESSKDVIRAWARGKGYETYADSVGMPMRDGSVRRVRVKYIDDGFERLERARSSFSSAVVLSMASTLDNVAAGYVDGRRRGDDRALATIAGDVFWCLDRIAATRCAVDPAYMPTFLGGDFFVPFTAGHADARPEMARAGIDVGAVLARLNAAEALREHSSFLAQYGLEGDVVTEQPGLFEGMRDLSNSKSVYTLRDRDSSNVGAEFPEHVLPPRAPAAAAAAGGQEEEKEKEKKEEEVIAEEGKKKKKEKTTPLKAAKKLPSSTSSSSSSSSRSSSRETSSRSKEV
ncbi:hypothetical protein F4778DRAFT_309939 [Xylariomycetidae sp. FL2044]|nr:hypothetical protein F4778DRAFT_309939 [Xylariomycetidae sp. FL2044]